MKAAFLRMKEKYLSVSLFPVKKSRWEIVRSIVMFGKGEGTALGCSKNRMIVGDIFCEDDMAAF